ncbi:MAG: FAD-dependent oxidoreductase [Rhodobacteraceae bacterium]|jgi:dimethylglycine dehydrogenase|nr:FAD-dependent oxidoreductase [Paracoccaceae bacterium]
MKSQARVVIIGGGIYGVSLAYWLARYGWDDVVLLEQGELTSGQTWHAAGFVTNYAFDINTMRINDESVKLYKAIGAETGHDPGWITSGTLRLLYTPMQYDGALSGVAWAEQVGVRAEIVSPGRAKELNPFLNEKPILGAIYTPDDGSVDPARITHAIAAGARSRGAEINRQTKMTAIAQLPDRRWKVTTTKGDIIADHVVNSAGFYAREVGEMVGVNVATGVMQHQYVITEPIPAVAQYHALHGEFPTLRDAYAAMYMRREQQGICLGCYETEGAQFFAPEGMPPDWDTELLSNHIESVAPWMEMATETVPVFAEAGIKTIINGPQIFSVTGKTYVGRAPGLHNFWLLCGSSTGITQGGGTAKMLAQYMIHGEAEVSLAGFDPANVGRYADRAYTLARIKSNFERVFVFHSPYEEPHGARPGYCDPLYGRLQRAGASFGEAFGWERANWFAPEGVPAEDEQSFRHCNFTKHVAEECHAVQKAVGVCNLSAFSKIEVGGRDAHAFLDRLVARVLPRDPGHVTLAHYLNDKGRVIAEHTITRRKDGSFYLVFASTAGERDLGMLQLAVREDEDVTLRDLRHDYGTLLVTGPKSGEVLATLTEADLSNAAFPWLSAREIDLAGRATLALRVSYAGELGWELHVPMADLAEVYDAVMAAGAAQGMRNIGIRALNALRLEKGYRGFGTELSERWSLLQAGMGGFASARKTYRGRAAVDAERKSPASSQLVCMSVENADNDAWGDEPIYSGDRCVGAVTSGGCGFRVNQSIAFGLVEAASAPPGTELNIKMLGQLRRATVLGAPLYDPDNARLKAEAVGPSPADRHQDHRSPIVQTS